MLTFGPVINFLRLDDFRWQDAIDILVVASLIYWILRAIRGTRAIYMLIGISVAFVVFHLSQAAKLYTLNWVFSNLFGSLLIVMVILFQNDLRRVLAQLGRTPLFSLFQSSHDFNAVEELVKTCVSLANKKIGALIVLERSADLQEYVEMGIRMDAAISKEIMTSIFLPQSPVHDGAALIQKWRIAAAGCFLPLTMNPQVGNEYGTRHRAAIGLTEETDAIVIVISEEKGWISMVEEGRVTKGLDGLALRKLLLAYLSPKQNTLRRWIRSRV